MNLFAKDENGVWHDVVMYDGRTVLATCDSEFATPDSPVTRPPLGQRVCGRCFRSLN